MKLSKSHTPFSRLDLRVEALDLGARVEDRVMVFFGLSPNAPFVIVPGLLACGQDCRLRNLQSENVGP